MRSKKTPLNKIPPPIQFFSISHLASVISQWALICSHFFSSFLFFSPPVRFTHSRHRDHRGNLIFARSGAGDRAKEPSPPGRFLGAKGQTLFLIVWANPRGRPLEEKHRARGSRNTRGREKTETRPEKRESKELTADPRRQTQTGTGFWGTRVALGDSQISTDKR